MKFIVGIVILTVVYITAKYLQNKAEDQEQDAYYKAKVAAASKEKKDDDRTG